MPGKSEFWSWTKCYFISNHQVSTATCYNWREIPINFADRHFIPPFVSDQKPSMKRQSSGRIKGELKLTLEYRRDSLHVMVCHAKNLALPDGSKEEPNSYAKVGSPPRD